MSIGRRRGPTVTRPARALVLATAVVAVAAGCGAADEEPPAGSPEEGAAPPQAEGEWAQAPGPAGEAEMGEEVAASGYLGPVGDAGRAIVTGDTTDGAEEIDPDAPWVETEKDREILHETVGWAREQTLEILPIGEMMGMVGSTFVGVPYKEAPLEVEGEERLVVDLRGMDCVTFVEQVLAMSHVVRLAEEEELEDPEALAERFRDLLATIRYRDGEMDGYPSRLHYFSEWIADNEAQGLVRDLTRSMGGQRVEEPISFMSSNPDAYRQLSEDPGLVEEIAGMEERLSERQRYVIPQEEIADREEGLRTGDIIAATSTVDGLDVAHTGIAVWHQGRVHLLHAPLQDGTVEISPRPLADRILDIDGQDGIMVARPTEPGDGED